MTIGLPALEARLAEGLERLNYPPRDWVPVTTGPDDRAAADVFIVGGGMNGLAAAFALRRLGIVRIHHIDARPPGQEGPWLDYARMEYLRSPKHLTGPAQGLPDLTFRAWWTAQFGEDGWERLGYITRQDWAVYLAWYGRVTGAGVQNDTRLQQLSPEDGLILADLEGAEGAQRVYARQVVLATGREGHAGPRIPTPFEPFLGSAVRHSSEPLDVQSLQGRRVVVIGLSACQ